MMGLDSRPNDNHISMDILFLDVWFSCSIYICVFWLRYFVWYSFGI